MLRYRYNATLKSNGILVERQLHISGDNWQTVDRYNTDDLSKQPKKQAAWVENAMKYFNQEKVHIIHTPNCSYWSAETCDCGANETHNTPLHIETLKETANCRIDGTQPDTAYDGQCIEAIDDAAKRIMAKAANG